MGRGVAARRPAQELLPVHEVGLAVREHEGAVGELGERGAVMPLTARRGLDALAVELLVEGVGASLARVERAPDLDEPVVVRAAAQRARAVTGRERRRLVEEEQFREATGLHERCSVPAAELELARDPALHGEASPDASLGVVQAAAVPIDEPARRVGDQVAERRDAILSRHCRGR